MDRKEIDVLAMIYALLKFLNDNLALFADKPSFIEVRLQLEAMAIEIEALEKQRGISTKSDSIIKKNSRTDVTKKTLKVVGALAAHAAKVKDVKLKVVSDVSKTMLKNLRDSDFITCVGAIYDAAGPLVPELIIWGVLQEEVDYLGENSGRYKEHGPAIRNIQLKTKQAKVDMKLKFDEVMDLIRDSLDPMMLPFKQLNPSFHSQYISVRTIIHHPGTHPGKEEGEKDTPTETPK